MHHAIRVNHTEIRCENPVMAKFGKYGFVPGQYEGPLPQRGLYYHRGTSWRVREEGHVSAAVEEVREGRVTSR
jgi:hypothetical protein